MPIKDKPINAVRCTHCKKVVVSRDRHDFACCDCPRDRRICVDGGPDYRRRVFGEEAKWVEILERRELQAGPKAGA